MVATPLHLYDHAVATPLRFGCSLLPKIISRHYLSSLHYGCTTVALRYWNTPATIALLLHLLYGIASIEKRNLTAIQVQSVQQDCPTWSDGAALVDGCFPDRQRKANPKKGQRVFGNLQIIICGVAVASIEPIHHFNRMAGGCRAGLSDGNRLAMAGGCRAGFLDTKKAGKF